MSGTGNRLIGGVFGDTQPSTADDGSLSGVYTMPDQYYITQEGGWNFNLDILQLVERSVIMRILGDLIIEHISLQLRELLL